MLEGKGAHTTVDGERAAMDAVEQGSLQTSYGGWLADEIARRYFDWLDAPVARVHGSESSPSISKVLEAAALASTSDIVDALRSI